MLARTLTLILKIISQHAELKIACFHVSTYKNEKILQENLINSTKNFTLGDSNTREREPVNFVVFSPF